jgi:hypothetical protein
MNRKYYFLSLIVLSCMSGYAQKDPIALFKAQQVKMDSIFDKKIGALKARGASNTEFDKSKLAAISDDYMIFWQEDDVRANKAANIDFLQDGRIKNIPLVGKKMSVAIYDGGKARASHEDFQLDGASRIVDLEANIPTTQQPISAHPTAVAGFIAANGTKTLTLTSNGGQTVIPNASQGVVPFATVKTAGFATTANGNNYVKIMNHQEPISNHSYGTNYGWSMYTYDTNAMTMTWRFPVDTNIFQNDEETLMGAYMGNDYNFDLITSWYPQMTIIKSAGNYDGDGPGAYGPEWTQTFQKYTSAGYVDIPEGEIIPKANSFNGAYSISTGSLAKNIIVVGATDLPAVAGDYRANTTADIVKSDYSSVGPRKDGGIKPDLVTVGSSLISPTSSGDASYSVGSGTSYSAPKVTGAVVALTELKRALTEDSAFIFDSDQVKALLLHTTQEAGPYPGPDNKYGWGALDAKRAAELVLSTHNGDDFFAKNIKVEGVNFEKTVSSRNGEPLKVTMTWIDPQVQDKNMPTTTRAYIENKVSRLVNDLDLRIVDTETGEEFYPWKLDINNVTGPALKGDNTVDNVEQILIDSPVAGRNYKIVVSNKGRLYDSDEDNTGEQAYTLLITGANDEVLSSGKNTFTTKVVVYPTVASTVVNVATDSEISLVQVYDVTGKLVTTAKTKTVDVSNLAGGLYLLKITSTKGEVVTKKFIKE